MQAPLIENVVSISFEVYERSYNFTLQQKEELGFS